MATLAVRLRRGLTLARAFSTATLYRAQPSSSGLIPTACSLQGHVSGFTLPSSLLQCPTGHRRVSNWGPVCSPMDSDNKRGETTILFEGCDYEHWLITMEFPEPQPTREEKIDTFIKTLAKVVGSEEEAKKRIYALSTTTYTGFQAQISEELSEKMKGLPGVVWVLPDSYIDPVNKEYGGDKYINGVIIPDTRVYNNRPSGRFNDRPRNRMRRDSMPVERRDTMPMDGRGGMQGDRRDFRPPIEGRDPMPGGQQDYNRPPGVQQDFNRPLGGQQDYNRPPQNYNRPRPQGPFPTDRQDYNRPLPPPPLPMEGRGPVPGGPQDYNRPPQNYSMSPPQSYSRPPQDYNRPPQQDYNRVSPPPIEGRGPMSGYQQDYNRAPPPPPMEGRGTMPGYQQDYNRSPPPMEGRGPMPSDYNRPPPPMEGRGPMQGDYNRPPPPPSMEGRAPMGGDYNRSPPPPMEGRSYQQDYYRPPPPPPSAVQGERQDYRPPMDGRGPIPGDRQDYRSTMDGRGPVQGGGRSDYMPPRESTQGGSFTTQGQGSVQGEQKDAFPWPMEEAQ